MRKIEIRNVESFETVYAAGEYTGLHYTKSEINAMLDDLVDTYGSSMNPRGKRELLAELLTKTLDDSDRNHTLKDGPLTPEEIREVTRIVEKSCKKGCFN